MNNSLANLTPVLIAASAMLILIAARVRVRCAIRVPIRTLSRRHKQ
jgi:hypothetical protein